MNEPYFELIFALVDKIFVVVYFRPFLNNHPWLFIFPDLSLDNSNNLIKRFIEVFFGTTCCDLLALITCMLGLPIWKYFFAKFWMAQLIWSARWSRAKVTDTHVNRANTIGSHFTLASDKQRKKKQSNKIIIKETMKQYYSPNQALKIVFKNTKSFNCFIFSELEVWNTIQFSWKKCLQPPKLLFDPMKNQNFKVVLP